jgi:hypothetical protein
MTPGAGAGARGRGGAGARDGFRSFPPPVALRHRKRDFPATAPVAESAAHTVYASLAYAT